MRTSTELGGEPQFFGLVPACACCILCTNGFSSSPGAIPGRKAMSAGTPLGARRPARCGRGTLCWRIGTQPRCRVVPVAFAPAQPPQGMGVVAALFMVDSCCNLGWSSRACANQLIRDDTCGWHRLLEHAQRPKSGRLASLIASNRDIRESARHAARSSLLTPSLRQSPALCPPFLAHPHAASRCAPCRRRAPS